MRIAVVFQFVKSRLAKRNDWDHAQENASTAADNIVAQKKLPAAEDVIVAEPEAKHGNRKGYEEVLQLIQTREAAIEKSALVPVTHYYG